VGARDAPVIAALVAGAVFLVLLIVVERRAANAMLPMRLFAIRNFSLANALTLFLYAALAEMMFLVPMQLIEVRRLSATAAGAWLLPFPVIMFALSRWSGGLVGRIGPRLPLTVGPLIAAVGLALFTTLAGDGATAPRILAAVITLGLGMAITVAPLTTTVMNSVDGSHSGVASGVNNAVSRVAGLIAIAVFGVVIANVFQARVSTRLESVTMTSDVRAALNRELPKMAGASLAAVPVQSPDHRRVLRQAIDASFNAAFRHAMFGAAALAVLAAIIGFAIV
jgi:predicted MFS family arabinose efflux permease